MVATAVVAVLGATAAGLVAQSAAGSAGSGLLVTAQFADASPLLVGNDVKIDGVAVGQVAAMDVSGNLAMVTMFLDAAALPVHDDARFTIRPVSLLGERFVDLDRGSPDAPVLDSGDLVTIERTTTNTDLDQILNTLDDPTGEALAVLVTTLGSGLDGNGANADQTIRALAPALTDTAAFAGVLRDQNSLLNQLVDRLEPVAGALATEDGRRLDQLVSTTETLLAATAAQSADLEATLAELPATLAAARTTLDRVAGTAGQTTPTLRELRPLTDELRVVSDELYAFADALDPALASTDPVLERGRALLAETGPVVASLRAAGPDLRATASSARPLVDELTGNLDNVYDFIRFWAMTANGRDALSSYFRGFVVVNPQSLTGLLPEGLQDVPLPGAVEGAMPGGPLGGGLPGVPAPAGTGGLLAPVAPGDDPGADDDGGATGLDEEQERGMVDFLLGGAG
jgi:phospholipid/cholesterol/gamma-HCH transport system substrate-binding protein